MWFYPQCDWRMGEEGDDDLIGLAIDKSPAWLRRDYHIGNRRHRRIGKDYGGGCGRLQYLGLHHLNHLLPRGNRP